MSGKTTEKAGGKIEGVRTHLLASEKYCGKVVEIGEGRAKVVLETTDEMKVDEKGLVHGGFTFSLADYSAMVAVNHPFVVLAKANVKFIKPVKVGDKLYASAEVKSEEGRKKTVEVKVFRDSEIVFEGEFLCVVLDKHVIDLG